MTLQIVTFCSRDYNRYLARLSRTLNRRALEMVVYSEDQAKMDRLLDRENKRGHHFTGVDVKIAYVLQHLERTPAGEWFVWCDATAYFTDPCFALESMPENTDVLFAREYKKSTVNIGVMAIRKTDKSVRFFGEVKRRIRADGAWDQRVVNALLGLGRGVEGPLLGLSWGYLPEDKVRVASAIDRPPRGPPPGGLVKLIRTSLVHDTEAFWKNADEEDIANGFPKAPADG